MHQTYFAEGDTTATLSETRASDLLDGMLAQWDSLRRVLLLPPDITRLHSWAGPLTCLLYQKLQAKADVHILPAIGTHYPMTDAEIARMFPGIPRDRFHAHDWRNGLVRLGEVPGSFLHQVSEGRVDYPVAVEVAKLLAEGKWDRIISIGQLVPHEVIGIANHNKNVFVGAGGGDTINKSHFLGAVYGMERIMGRAKSPVRDVLNYASTHCASHLPLTYVLTVRARGEGGQLVTRGLYAGDDENCFLTGAELCRQVNLDLLDRAPRKMVVYLDPEEFKSTWLGNKAIYRTRMAIADDGELIILAPGVREFGEDRAIDTLIREYGYRGTPTILEAVRSQPNLGANLSAAAHLIHGSSEGRFTITYCPGGLTREEVEGVYFQYGSLAAMRQRYNPEKLRDGWNTLPDGEEIFYISNPALGLWGTKERF